MCVLLLSSRVQQLPQQPLLCPQVSPHTNSSSPAKVKKKQVTQVYLCIKSAKEYLDLQIAVNRHSGLFHFTVSQVRSCRWSVLPMGLSTSSSSPSSRSSCSSRCSLAVCRHLSYNRYETIALVKGGEALKREKRSGLEVQHGCMYLV